jgi:hypothetical protein
MSNGFEEMSRYKRAPAAMQLKTMIEMTKGFDLKILIRKSSHIDVVEINFFNSVGKVLDS